MYTSEHPMITRAYHCPTVNEQPVPPMADLDELNRHAKVFRDFLVQTNQIL